MKSEIDSVMDRCKAGTNNYNATNDLHADCYRLIGRMAYSLRRIYNVSQKEGIECIETAEIARQTLDA